MYNSYNCVDPASLLLRSILTCTKEHRGSTSRPRSNGLRDVVKDSPLNGEFSQVRER